MGQPNKPKEKQKKKKKPNKHVFTLQSKYELQNHMFENHFGNEPL